MVQNLVVAHVGVASQEQIMKGASVVALYDDLICFELINLLGMHDITDFSIIFFFATVFTKSFEKTQSKRLLRLRTTV
jgi:hypothetical protein